MTSVMVRAKSRRDILTAAECASPLAARVYDLRHACVSMWLNGGIPPAQVAEWAGQSVAIPLKIYAKCLDGQDAIAERRIEEALGDVPALAAVGLEGVHIHDLRHTGNQFTANAGANLGNSWHGWATIVLAPR